MALQTTQQIEDSISNSNHALVAFRKDWTVDAVASALALANLLEARGKKVDVVADGFVPTRQVAFLPNVARVTPEFGRLRKFVISLDVSKTPIDELTYHVENGRLNIHLTPKIGQFREADLTSRSADFKYDLIFTVGTPDFGSLGRLFSEHSDLFHDCPVVNIDHDAQNENYGNVNAVDITATSTAEIVHRLIARNGGGPHDEDTATALLAGIISATRSFRAATVTPLTLDIAAELVAAGARRDEIVQNLYKTRSLSTLKLWGRALARLKYDAETKTVWSLIVRQDFVHSGSDENCLPEVMSELMATAPEADIVGLIYERDAIGGTPSGVCAMVTSDRHADALGLVPDLRPEGHRRLARICFAEGNIQDAERAVLNSIRKSLGKVKQPEFVGRIARAAEKASVSMEAPALILRSDEVRGTGEQRAVTEKMLS
jgi:nanoRNase/pAp phosphatase (c-di-AMP/oligoRNAs hydrolase)